MDLVSVSVSISICIFTFQGEAGEKKVISFIFQESKYEYDYESNCFQVIEFPTKLRLKTYLNHKGYQDDEESNLATRKYGPNRYLDLLSNKLCFDWVICNFIMHKQHIFLNFILYCAGRI